MSDLVVTVPKSLWLGWIDEGDAVGEPPTGEEWGYFVSSQPTARAGDRCYVVSHGRLRGYAPIVRIARDGKYWGIVRAGGAVACTVPFPIPGFRGFRARWWDPKVEVPFPDWKTGGILIHHWGASRARTACGRAGEKSGVDELVTCTACRERAGLRGSERFERDIE